jgi:hypothetical protein
LEEQHCGTSFSSVLAFEVIIYKMQHHISYNDMNEPGQGRPVLDSITHKFLRQAFDVLHPHDAIAITGSCIVAMTQQNHNIRNFLPGDIDVFVRQKFHVKDQMFDRYFLDQYILTPLLKEGVRWQPRDIPVEEGSSIETKKYINCKIDMLQIINIDLIDDDDKPDAVNRPKIQIIIVAEDAVVPREPRLWNLTTFEQKVVTSFDFDIVQGVYNPKANTIKFAYEDAEDNIKKNQFWLILDPQRSYLAPSMVNRFTKYLERGFELLGLKDINDHNLTMSFSNFRINQPAPFEPETGLQEGMIL